MSGYAEYREVNLPWLKAVPAHWEIRRNKNIFTEQKEIVGERSADYTLLSLTLGKFKYMGAYLRWFYRKNFRKYVNISPAIWDTSFS